MCQCPLTGNTHFYTQLKSNYYADWNVSMPSNGQHSFLPIVIVAGDYNESVSMPSNGQHSFLRYEK